MPPTERSLAKLAAGRIADSPRNATERNSSALSRCSRSRHYWQAPWHQCGAGKPNVAATAVCAMDGTRPFSRSSGGRVTRQVEAGYADRADAVAAVSHNRWIGSCHSLASVQLPTSSRHFEERRFVCSYPLKRMFFFEKDRRLNYTLRAFCDTILSNKVVILQLRGGYMLTEREQQCATWLVEGKTSWEIAQILGSGESRGSSRLCGNQTA
jgi:hypothetical protein